MAARAAWTGTLKFGSVACGIKLVGATSESGKVHFRILNRKTREPVKGAYVDESTGKLVETEDQVKGFELSGGDFLVVEPEEIKELKVSSEHTLEVETFVDRASIDRRYLDKPYYVIPADAAASETFAVIREAMKKKDVAARSCVVLYQRGREVVLEPYRGGMLMTTLRPHREMVSEAAVFKGLKQQKSDPEMLEIAGLLIDKKAGKFDPSTFEDRYEDALIEMIKAKQHGKKPPKPVAAPRENVINLADVLKKSLEKEGIKRGGAKPAAKEKAAPRREKKSA